MKKQRLIVVAALVLLAVSGEVFSQERQEAGVKSAVKIIVKYGMDTNGLQNYPSTIAATFPVIDTQSSNVDLGSSLLIEIQNQTSEMLCMGIGATFNTNRKLTGQAGEFNFLPVYVTASLFPLGNLGGGLAPYAKGDLGYNVSFTGNDDYKAPAPFTTVLTGGIYWGLGAGVKLANTIFVDIMYTTYAGTYKVSIDPLSTEFPILYSKVSLNAGIGFDL